METLASLNPFSYRLRDPPLYCITQPFHRWSFLLFLTYFAQIYIHSSMTKLQITVSFLSLPFSPESLLHLSIILFSILLLCFLINRCVFASDLWFAKSSPPYGSGEAILVFLVCSSPKNVISLGKGKSKTLKKWKQIFPFISKSIHPLLILVSLSEWDPVIKTLADENIIEPCSSSEHYCWT